MQLAPNLPNNSLVPTLLRFPSGDLISFTSSSPRGISVESHSAHSVSGKVLQETIAKFSVQGIYSVHKKIFKMEV